MKSKTFVSSLVSGFSAAALSLGMASAWADELEFPDAPLFVTERVIPALVMAVDDSGSMDSEVLVPTNDGAAWWLTSGSSSGDCTAALSASFVGCGANPTSSRDIPSAGTPNFNWGGGASGTWKKYIYLFPNGAYSGNSRVYADGDNDHFAVPPTPQFAWLRSHQFNAGYFDPTVTYVPWQNQGSYSFADSSPTSARFDPVKTGTANIDLTLARAGTTSVAESTACLTMTQDPWLGYDTADNHRFRVYTGMVIPAGTCYQIRGSSLWLTTLIDITVGVTQSAGATLITNGARLSIRYFPATFYVASLSDLPAGYGYIGTPTNGLAPDGSALLGIEIRPDNFESTTAYDAAIQNFANWFTYYRKRHLALRAGLGLSFESVKDLRVGGFTINNRTTNITMRDMSVVSDKNSLYQDFYDNWRGSGGTPNIEAVANMVSEFKRTNSGAPVQLSCQQNFGMLFTDGFSNAAGTGVGNYDGDKGEPYADTVSNLLPDLTMKAYSESLRTDIDQGQVKVPTECALGTADPWVDCNDDPHMNFYAITLGAKGTVYDPDAPQTVEYPYENPPVWPTVTRTSRNPVAVDDLWHAAINGRGELLNARTPQEITDKLTALLVTIADKTATASSVALNSSYLDTETLLFQAEFHSSDWTGTLNAYRVSSGDPYDTDCSNVPVGELCAAGGWDSASALELIDPDDRTILTYNPAEHKGIPFKWSALSEEQQEALNTNPDTLAEDDQGELRLAYLRGDQAQEDLDDVPRFRSRSQLQGDIINSDPFYVGVPAYAYEFDGYSTFRDNYASRTPIVYVGANDGMLHGFRAEDGAEVLAYVPSVAFGDESDPKLSKLTDTENTHRWFVDASPTVGDVQVNGSWRSVLVGTMRQGGQAVFALNVTNPANFGDSAGQASSIVMWEFTNEDDEDLGHTFSQPSIVRLADDKWYAVVSSGYNSETEQGAVFILSIAGPGSDNNWNEGSDYYKIELPTSGASGDDSVGVATPALIDLDGDDAADYAYVGDLQGNMWRIDLTDADPGEWVLANAGTPVAIAKDHNGDRQPITARAEVGLNLLTTDDSNDVIVYFGSGRYIDSSDNQSVDQQNQSFYGVFDDPSSSATRTAPARSALLEQFVELEVYENGSNYRISSANALDLDNDKGWFIDLYNTDDGDVSDSEAEDGANLGERQVSTPILRNGRIIFTTLLPSSDACEAGGSGWLMELDAQTGGRLAVPTLDVNDDGIIDENDYITVTIDGEEVLVPVSGEQSEVGIIPRPTILPIDDETEIKYAGGTQGEIATFTESSTARTGRISWREIRH